MLLIISYTNFSVSSKGSTGILSGLAQNELKDSTDDGTGQDKGT